MKKRLMALFLCGVMTVGMMPTAIAADVEVLEEGPQPTEVVARVCLKKQMRCLF